MEIKGVDKLQELRMGGYIFTRRKARKDHKCKECPTPIAAGDEYFEVVIGGGGLGSLKFPSRIHIGCLNSYRKR